MRQKKNVLQKVYGAVLWSLSGLLCVGCPGPTGMESDTDSDVVVGPTDRVLEEMAAVIEDFKIPGLSVAIMDADGVLWSAGVGVSDVDLGTAMTGSTALKAGSTTKTLIGARALQLLENGAFALDDEVSGYVDVLPATHGITVEQLLNHSSGLGNHLEYMAVSDFQDVWQPADLIALLDGQPLLFEPGTSYAYSNANYVLLGMIIEEVTGQPWSDELNAMVAELGISSGSIWIPAMDEDWSGSYPGYFVLPDGELYTHQAQTYNTIDDLHHTIVGAAGNMLADAEGLVQWGDAYWGGQDVISKDTKETMTATVAPGSDYGLGVVAMNDAHGSSLFHNGALNGYESYVGYRPEDGVTLSFLGNAWLSVGDTCCLPGWNWEVSQRLWLAFYAE